MNAVLPINTLAGRSIGDNSARVPLTEVLAEELAADMARAEELLAAAAEARITSDAEAAKVADLIVLIRDHERGLDRKHHQRKQQIVRDGRAIDAAFAAIVNPLLRARIGDGGKYGLNAMLSAWRETRGWDAPLATSIAAIGYRREISFVIDDLPAALDWLLKNRSNEIAQAARTIIGAALRSIGVDAAAEADIPGVTITITKRTQVR